MYHIFWWIHYAIRLTQSKQIMSNCCIFYFCCKRYKGGERETGLNAICTTTTVRMTQCILFNYFIVIVYLSFNCYHLPTIPRHLGLEFRCRFSQILCDVCEFFYVYTANDVKIILAFAFISWAVILVGSWRCDLQFTVCNDLNWCEHQTWNLTETRHLIITVQVSLCVSIRNIIYKK